MKKKLHLVSKKLYLLERIRRVSMFRPFLKGLSCVKCFDPINDVVLKHKKDGKLLFIFLVINTVLEKQDAVY